MLYFLLPTLTAGLILVVWVRSIRRRIAMARAKTALSASDINNDGQELEEKLAWVESRLRALSTSLHSEVKAEFLDRLNQDFEAGRAFLQKESKFFKSEFESIRDTHAAHAFLNREQDRVVQGFSQATAEARGRLERLKKLKKAHTVLREQVRSLLSVKKPSYIVLRKGEELQIEKEDSRLVRSVKWIRRVLIPVERLWIPLIRPLWPAEARRSFQLSSQKRLVPFKKILGARVGGELSGLLEMRFVKVEKAIAETQKELEESLRVLHFNLDSAAAMAEEGELGQKDVSLASLEKASLNCLERAQNRFDDLIENGAKAAGAFEKELSEDCGFIQKQIRRDCDVADTFGRRVAAAIESVRDTYGDSRKWFVEQSPHWKRSLEAWIRWGQGRISRAQSRLGFEKASRAEVRALLEDMNYQRLLKDFPPLYRRLFRPDPLADEQFLVGRDREMAHMKTALEKWQDQKSVSVAVYGRNGNGKTSFLKCALQKFAPDQRVFWVEPKASLSSGSEVMKYLAGVFGLPAPAVSGDFTVALADTVNKEINPAIVVIEGGHFLFERRVGGFDSLREFLTLMALTRPKILWVLSFNEASWIYLDRAVHLSKYFTTSIPVNGLSRKEMEKAVLQRHEISGFSLEADFSGPVSQEIKKKAARLEEGKPRLDFALDLFFDHLFEKTEGNIVSAFYGWLNNLTFNGDDGFLLKPPFQMFPDLSGYLSPNETHAVLAILQQGTMNQSHLGNIMRMSERESRLTLKALADSRILNDPTPSAAAEYQVNTVLLPSLYQVFKEKNLLFEGREVKP